MDNTVMVALISGLAVAIPSIIATIFNGNANRKLTDYKLQELSDKIKELNDNQKKHSELFERMYKVETDVKTVFKRIDDIRNDLHAGDNQT